MNKPRAVIEVSSDSLKLLIGYIEEGKPVVVFSQELAIPGLISKGSIVDEEALTAAISQFHNIMSERVKLKAHLTSCDVVLPSLGLSCFETTKSTYTVDPSGAVSKVDVNNVLSLASKEASPDGLEAIGIIPLEFRLGDGRRFGKAPIGEISESLTVDAMVLFLPVNVKNSYRSAFLKAGFHISRLAASGEANAAYLSVSEPSISGAIILDMGARISTLTLDGVGRPYGASSFFSGGDDLTEAIASTLGLSFEEAEALKKERGYDTRERSYDPPLLDETSSNGRKIHQRDLNAAIESYYSTFFKLLKQSLSDLNVFGAEVGKLNLLLTGGGSLLYGLEELFAKELPDRVIVKMPMKTLGARSPRFSACLGVICLSEIGADYEYDPSALSNVGRVENGTKGKAVPEDEDTL